MSIDTVEEPVLKNNCPIAPMMAQTATTNIAHVSVCSTIATTPLS